MKKIPLIALLLIHLSLLCEGQIKCKIIKDEKDSFSGERTIITEEYSIGKLESMNKHVFANVIYSNGITGLRIYTLADMGCVSQQSRLLLKDGNK